MVEQKPSLVKTISLNEPILGRNADLAERNRRKFLREKVCVLNLLSSPGSGKTTLLVETIKILKPVLRCAVIEGDQQTDNDARRIAETGVPVVQINTGGTCHLDAGMIDRALQDLPLQGIDILFIENVGNLICPAEFDLGENAKVVLMSITEGEDKPVKYPLVFHLAKIMVLTKLDLLPYLRFDLNACIQNMEQINPNVDLIQTSAFSRQGMEQWVECIKREVSLVKTR
jgi:hydrogenase nickel incorporation protein HypB